MLCPSYNSIFRRMFVHVYEAAEECRKDQDSPLVSSQTFLRYRRCNRDDSRQGNVCGLGQRFGWCSYNCDLMQSWGRRNSGDIPNPLPSLVNVLAITCTQSSCQRSWPFLVQGLSSLLTHCGHSGSYLSMNQGPERWRLYGVAGSTCQSPYPGLVGGHSSWNTSFVWPSLPTEAYLLSSNPTQEKRPSNLFLWELRRHPGP